MLQKIQDKIRILWKGSLNKESARMNLAKNNNVVIKKTYPNTENQTEM